MYAYAGSSPFIYVDPTGTGTNGAVIGGIIGGVIGGIGGSVEPGGGNVAGAIGGAIKGAEIGSLVEDVVCSAEDPDCELIRSRLYDEMNNFDRRLNDLIEDKLNLFTQAYDAPNPSVTGTNTTYVGHEQKLRESQEKMRRYIKLLEKKGCDVPRGAYPRATRGLPNAPG